MSKCLAIILFLCPILGLGQTDSLETAKKNELFVNYGLDILTDFHSVFRFNTANPIYHIGYRRVLNDKIAINVSVKPEMYSSRYQVRNFEIWTSDSTIILQGQGVSTEVKAFQLQFGINHRIGRFFSLDYNLIGGYGWSPLNVRYLGKYVVIPYAPDTWCNECLEEYLGMELDDSTHEHYFNIGYGRRVLLGTAIKLNFEYPIYKNLYFQFNYGWELWITLDAGEKITMDVPPIEFDRSTEGELSHQFTTGLSFKF